MHEDIVNLAIKMGIQHEGIPEFMRAVLALGPEGGVLDDT